VAAANVFDWKERSRSLEDLAAYRAWDVNLTGVDDPEHIQACLVSPRFFPLLGTKPVRGRTFLSDEGRAGPRRGGGEPGLLAAPLRFDADMVGKRISLDGRSYTVVGVMPNEFDYPLATEQWAPLALTPSEKNQRAIHDSRSPTVLF